MECLRDNLYKGVVLDGRFETISPLNHGSFGMVFLAKDLLTNEKVAIKCLTKQSAVQDGTCNFAIDEKSEELACHARLGSHKDIVNLIHSFETDNHIYLVLEFCSKGDLYEAIRTGCGPLETQHVRDFMLQLISAVEYIHSKGMYHRDIKPENIFITEDGSMKLGDFGLATKETWSYETTVGSDRYMAPEQYDSAGAGYSPEKADIWAIGIILLNVLFSRNPFTTPTEADPLFLDFSRDNQSLFDVFSDMSQDTFEVVLNCMSLDPKKRSLQGARDAINRVVTFTISDELEDDFRTIMRKPIASANREPLRTPTIKTPQVEASNAFPWAKALNATQPQAIRQLSMIPDNESYTEELFPKSEESSKDWFSVGGQTPYSSLGASMYSIANSRPMMRRFQDLTPISGSLPINMAKPKSLASIFGNQEMVSKSWSDLYDEEFEEEQQDHQFRGRQAQNARTFSHDEVKVDETAIQFEEVEEKVVLATKSSSAVNIKSAVVEIESDHEVIIDIDGDNVNDGFFFQNSPPVSKESPALYSPPCKRNSGSMDKWAALGARRRAYTGQSADKAPDNWRSKKSVGMGTTLTATNSNSNPTLGASASGVWNHKPAATGGVHNAKDGFWIRGKDHHQHSLFFSRTPAVYHHRSPVNEQENVDHTAKEDHHHDNLGDLEWVGGWGDSVAGLQL